MWPWVATEVMPGAISLPASYGVTLRLSASNTRRTSGEHALHASLVCRLISPSSMKYFHSAAGTRISAFGNDGLLSASSRPLMWSPWKCEMMTMSTALRSMPDGLQVGVELAGDALAALEVGFAGAGVDDDQLGAGVDDDRRVRDRHLVLFHDRRPRAPRSPGPFLRW